MADRVREIVWLHGEIKTPPFSRLARLQAGLLLRRLQDGELLGLPHSRPLPVVGRRCHELRVADETVTWRIVYRLEGDAVVILEVFAKKSKQIPVAVIRTCRDRLARFEAAGGGEDDG